MKKNINGKYYDAGPVEIEDSKRDEYKHEIDKLKTDLASLDYKTIKHEQGELSETEWKHTIDACNAIRVRINELERKLND